MSPASAIVILSVGAQLVGLVALVALVMRQINVDKGRRVKCDRCWFCLGREGCPLPCDFCPKQMPLPRAVAKYHPASRKDEA